MLKLPRPLSIAIASLLSASLGLAPAAAQPGPNSQSQQQPQPQPGSTSQDDVYPDDNYPDDDAPQNPPQSDPGDDGAARPDRGGPSREAIIGIIGGAAILGGAIAAERNRDRRRRPPPPPPPRAVLVQATLIGEGGEVRRPAQNVRIRPVVTYAPKVFARNQGEWRVSLYCLQICENANPRAARGQSEPVRSYRVVNPLHDIEREAPPGSEYLFEPVRWEGPYPYELIVPAYDAQGPIIADYLVVDDPRAGLAIISTPLVDR